MNKISSRHVPETPLYTEGDCGVWALNLADLAIKDGKKVFIIFASDISSLHTGALYYHVAVEIDGTLYDSSGHISRDEMNRYAPTDEDEPFYVFSVPYDTNKKELIREVILKQAAENPFSDWDDEDDLQNVITFYNSRCN